MRCDCGGALEDTTVAELDFSNYAGTPSVLRNAPVMRCPQCGTMALYGEVINKALSMLVRLVLKSPYKLADTHAKFLRKSMRMTQQQLADKLGVNRVTVADWERGETPLSKEHDMMLRSVVAAHLIKGPRSPRLQYDLSQALDHARTEAAPQQLPPFVINEALRRLRTSDAPNSRH